MQQMYFDIYRKEIVLTHKHLTTFSTHISPRLSYDSTSEDGALHRKVNSEENVHCGIGCQTNNKNTQSIKRGVQIAEVRVHEKM